MNTRVGAFIADLFVAGICRYDFTTTIERINYEGGVRTVKSVPMGQKELKAIAQALLKMNISVGEIRQLLKVDSKYTDEQVVEGQWVPEEGVMVDKIVEAAKERFHDSLEEEK